MAVKSNQLGQAVQQIYELLSQFSDDDQPRIVRSVTALLKSDANPGMQTDKEPASSTPAGNGRDPVFSGHEELSPKEFLKHKDPQTDIERVACLAYYLTHYRDSRYFKTIDISTLNTEAAQRKFTNPTVAVKNAYARGYLASVQQKNHRQISAIGEQYVEALPDRQSAKAVMKNARPGRARKKRKGASRKAKRG